MTFVQHLVDMSTPEIGFIPRAIDESANSSALMVTGYTAMIQSFHWLEIEISAEDPETTEFERQKAEFEAIPADILAVYTNQFVVSVDGQIVDCDKDLRALTFRYFSQHGKDAPTYITHVGSPRRRVTFDTPLL